MPSFEQKGEDIFVSFHFFHFDDAALLFAASACWLFSIFIISQKSIVSCSPCTLHSAPSTSNHPIHPDCPIDTVDHYNKPHTPAQQAFTSHDPARLNFELNHPLQPVNAKQHQHEHHQKRPPNVHGHVQTSNGYLQTSR